MRIVYRAIASLELKPVHSEEPVSSLFPQHIPRHLRTRPFAGSYGLLVDRKQTVRFIPKTPIRTSLKMQMPDLGIQQVMT